MRNTRTLRRWRLECGGGFGDDVDADRWMFDGRRRLVADDGDESGGDEVRWCLEWWCAGCLRVSAENNNINFMSKSGDDDIDGGSMVDRVDRSGVERIGLVVGSPEFGRKLWPENMGRRKF
ncbi:hypothetical protein Tco_0738063 [Tanacetum coccineum]